MAIHLIKKLDTNTYKNYDFSAVKSANILISQKKLVFVLFLKTKEELKLVNKAAKHVDATDAPSRTSLVEVKTLSTDPVRKTKGSEKIRINRDYNLKLVMGAAESA